MSDATTVTLAASHGSGARGGDTEDFYWFGECKECGVLMGTAALNVPTGRSKVTPNDSWYATCPVGSNKIEMRQVGADEYGQLTSDTGDDIAPGGTDGED